MAEFVNPYDRPEFVARYARARPAPPGDLVTLLTQLSGPKRPRLVVDLGCGTGLSTRVWSGRALRIVGVDTNPNMLRRARPAADVEYRQRASRDTGLPTGSVDIVTCSQSLHWMPPRATRGEVARILRRGGVFAAYDYVVPPLIDPEVDRDFANLLKWAGLPPLPKEKAAHVDRLRRSRKFRWTGHCSVHGRDFGNARRAIDLALSIAHVAARLPEGPESRERHWTAFRRTAERVLGGRRRPFWWTYDVVLAVK